MSIAHAAWVHGVNVIVPSSWSALRQDDGTVVRPSKTTTVDWVHFPIPTPVIVSGTRLNCGTAIVRFGTGGQGSIRALRVRDGETVILDTEVNWSGALQ